MDSKNSNRVNMIRTTLQFCEENTKETEHIKAFAPALQIAKNKLVLIDQLDQIAGSTSKGVTLDTIALRNTMTEIAFKCANAIVAYAISIKNNTLKAQVNYTMSAFNKMKKDEIDDVCTTIKEVAEKYLKTLEDWGIVPQDITDLTRSVELYRVSTQNPRQAIIKRSEAIEHISQLVREIIDTVFQVMDKLVNTLKATNESFYVTYYKAREIIDSGKGSKTITVTLKPEEHKTIYRVINGSKFVNTGKTTLIYCGDHLPPCDMGDENTVTVKPGETVKVEFKSNNQEVKKEKIHFITITNLDKTQNGSCTVKVTSEFPVKE
jgi:hypothetical protein